jgi:hypothetical protein
MFFERPYLRVVTSASALALEAARDAGAVETLTHLTQASPTAAGLTA